MAPVAVLIWLESLQRFLLDGCVWPRVCQVVRDRHPKSPSRPAASAAGHYVGQVFNTTVVKVFPKNPVKNGILIVNKITWILSFFLFWWLILVTWAGRKGLTVRSWRMEQTGRACDTLFHCKHGYSSGSSLWGGSAHICLGPSCCLKRSHPFKEFFQSNLKKRTQK